jgi:hypothetical protein
MHVEYTLDILKPHQPSSSHLGRALMQLPGAESVKIKVDEIDQKTTSIYVKITGSDALTIENIEEKLEELNCSLHSVDEVIFSLDKNIDPEKMRF